MENLMEKVIKYFKMGINIKDSGEMGHLRREYVYLVMEEVMMVSGKMGSLLVTD